MFAYALVEWRRWKASLFRKTTLAAGLLSLVVILPSAYQTYALSIALVAASLLLGWFLGNSFRPGSEARRLLESYPGPLFDLLAGKLLSALAIWAYHALLLGPATLFIALLWTLPPLGILVLELYCLCLFLCALALGYLVSLHFDGGEHLVGLWFLALLFVPGLFFLGAQNLDPFRHSFGLFRSPTAIELISATNLRDPASLDPGAVLAALIYGLGALALGSLALLLVARALGKLRSLAGLRAEAGLGSGAASTAPSPVGGGSGAEEA